MTTKLKHNQPLLRELVFDIVVEVHFLYKLKHFQYDRNPPPPSPPKNILDSKLLFSRSTCTSPSPRYQLCVVPFKIHTDSMYIMESAKQAVIHSGIEISKPVSTDQYNTCTVLTSVP